VPHSQTGILIVNTGSPDAPTPEAVRAYLAEFLSDRHVVDMPRWLWWPILHGIILRTRPAKSAARYRKIWTDEGAPLIATTRRQIEALRAMAAERGADLRIEMAMCYGRPSLTDGLSALRDAGCERPVVLPMFPQWSWVTSQAVCHGVRTAMQRLYWTQEWGVVGLGWENPYYIAALAASVREHWTEHGRGERLLISFHSLPVRYLRRYRDPYADWCEATARALAAALELGEREWSISFQSKFGPGQWIGPATFDMLEAWAMQLRHVDVICPGFAADNLETLEEIAIEGAELFRAAGGEKLSYIPALGARPDHIAALWGAIERALDQH
jgi:protoporphyrin/coproporphyrin ferrochelatase